jgi:hypothetical protein
MSEKGWPEKEVQREEHQEVIDAVFNFFDVDMENDYRADVIRILSWDDTRTNYRNAEIFPWGIRGNDAPFVCDIVSEMLSDYNPFYWETEEFDKEYDDWDDEWGGRIRSCIRAGLDLAADPSMGVMGFTKADIERMYPGGVPKWVSGDWWKRNGDWKPVDWNDMDNQTSLFTG